MPRNSKSQPYQPLTTLPIDQTIAPAPVMDITVTEANGVSATTSGSKDVSLTFTLGAITPDSIQLPFAAKTGTYTITVNDAYISCIGTFSVTLPTASGIEGQSFEIKNAGTGTITVLPHGAETIEGGASAVLYAGYSITATSNGSDFIIV